MREIQTLSTRQLATSLVKAEEGSNPNIAPDANRVALVTDRLADVVVALQADDPANAWDKSALRSTQAEQVQTEYLARADFYAEADSKLVTL